jgi:hypothetical protein
VLAAFLSVVLNIMLIGSMLAFVGYSVIICLSADNKGERMMRFGSLFAGALVVLGAQAGRLGFSQFIIRSMSDSGVAITAVSGAAGVSLGFVFLRSAYRGNIFAVRVMIFIGMLAAAQFAEIYAQAVKANGYALGTAAVPNIAFVVGIILCLALTYDPKDPRGGFRRYRQLSAPDHEETANADTDIRAPMYDAGPDEAS